MCYRKREMSFYLCETQRRTRMLRKLKKILTERAKAADHNPFFCPTCNVPRYSGEVSCVEEESSLICKHCSASLCTVSEGPGRSISLSEAYAPYGEMPAFALSRTAS